MNIHSLLNDKGDDDAGNDRRSTSSSNRPALSALNTTPSSLQQPRPSDGYPFPPSAHPMSATATPPPPQPRPSNHYVNTPMGALSPGPYAYPQQPQLVQSPYAQPVTTPGGHAGQNHYFVPPPSNSLTPTSNHEYAPQSLHKSPMSPYSQSRPPPAQLFRHPSQQSSHHSSHPGTPLGPPPSRGSLQMHRESPQIPHQRKSSGASHASYSSQGALPPAQPQYSNQYQPHQPATQPQPAHLQRQVSGETNGHRSEREHSLSVSPKTIVTGLPKRVSVAATSTPGDVLTREGKSVMPDIMNREPHGMSTVLEEPKSGPTSASYQQHKDPALNSTPAQRKQSAACVGTSSHADDNKDSTQVPKRGRDSSPVTASLPPAKRRRVIKPPPIWAQTSKSVRPEWRLPRGADRHLQRNGATPAINGHSSNKMVANPRTAGPNVAALGPEWESSVTNVIPFEETTREISNFLWQHVVKDQAIGTGEAGALPSSLGQYEIEARLGRLIDPKTHQRFQLPVKSEVVIREDVEVAFESRMTEEQHKLFNDRLNEYTTDSMKPVDGPKQRTRITYTHTKEIDAFFDLPDSEISLLPPSMQILVRGNRARKPKLRVTRDEKTGAILAKIIKIKIKDMHIYSPRTEFDLRISVNAEMNWDGDVSQLSPATGSQDRRKDRVSYKHLFFQIDLTQVTSPPSPAKTHELEVELSSSEVRKQGLLAEQGKPNGYEDLVKAFADNARILSRRFGWQ